MKKHWIIVFAVAIFLILVGAVALYSRYNSLGDPSAPVPPPSPSVATTTDNGLWKVSIDQETGLSFHYPERLLSEFITAPVWPPRVRSATGTLLCVEKMEDRGESIAKRTIDTRSYCVTEESEGAAGSVYTTYTYQTQKGGKIISADFTLRAVQCANYDEPKKIACGEEREAFDIDSVIDRIIQSVSFPQ